jgi:hypothetical protein
MLGPSELALVNCANDFNRPVFKMHNNVAMLALYPEFKNTDIEEPITEMIFVIDRYAPLINITRIQLKHY